MSPPFMLAGPVRSGILPAACSSGNCGHPDMWMLRDASRSRVAHASRWNTPRAPSAPSTRSLEGWQALFWLASGSPSIPPQRSGEGWGAGLDGMGITDA